MGKYVDWVIKETPDKDEFAQKIINSLFVERVRGNKPCIIMLAGDSGEGKSENSLNFANRILRIQGLDFKEYVNDVCVYTPLEYPKKMKALLEEKRLKKVIVMIIDEAREVIKASEWQSFVNITIADIQATFRRIKPMIIILNTQFIGDIDPKIRRTLTFYGECYRPLHGNAYMKLNRLWKDTGDIQNPKLRKRKVRGIVIQNGKRILYSPKRIKFARIDKSILEIYDENSYRAKKELINYKLEKLMESMNKEYGGMYTKVNAAVDYYSSDPLLWQTVIERYRGKFRVKKNVHEMLGFSKEEIESFQKKLGEKIAEKGFAEIINTEKKMEEKKDVSTSDTIMGE